MDIPSLDSSPNLDAVMQSIERHDMTKHALDLATYGFTVVPPEKLGVDDGFVERLRNAIIKTHERRHGVDISDYKNAELDASVVGRKAWRLLFEDQAFVDATLNPVALSLIRFLLGRSAVLSANLWLVKPPTENKLGLHTDTPGIALGTGDIAHVVNASWLCTDYIDADDGPTVLVPGSYRFVHGPLPHETNPIDTPFNVVPLEGKAGSLAVWHGGTWHGSVPRRRKGLRITFVQNWMRSYMKTINRWDDAPAELLERHPELTRILGLDSFYPYDSEPENTEGTYIVKSSDPYA